MIHTTSRLVCRANVAAGQTGGALHTMAALQADLLKDLDHGKGLSKPQKS